MVFVLQFVWNVIALATILNDMRGEYKQFSKNFFKLEATQKAIRYGQSFQRAETSKTLLLNVLSKYTNKEQIAEYKDVINLICCLSRDLLCQSFAAAS